jgi:hypothetical protein
MTRWILLAAAMLPVSASAQVAGPPAGGVLNRFLAPPTNLQQDFVGTWNLTWDDPVNPDCPCHGTLTIVTQANGELKGYWSMKGAAAVLQGGVAYDGNAWAGSFAQPDDVDFPIKGHFRLATRGQDGGLVGSYHRDGTSIPFHWSATRR